MNDEANKDREIADLLPFYATGALAEGDRARVAAALATEPALRSELEAIHEERFATIEANEAVGAPSQQARDRLFAMLATEAPSRAKRFDVVGWVAMRLEMLRPRTRAWAGATALVVIAVQVSVIGLLVAHRPTPNAKFETASINEQQTTAPNVVVAFAADAKLADIEKLLTEVNATILSGPGAGGLFEIHAGGEAPTAADTSAVVAKLKAAPSLVRFAASIQTDHRGN